MATGSILIVGASRGIGKALVENLASVYPQSQLIAVSRKITDIQPEFDRSFGNVQCLDADMSQTEGYFGLADQITNPIKYLVYVSGEAGPKYAENPSPEDFDRIMSINTKAPYFLTKELAPKFENNAKIIYISSGLARFYGPPYPIYSISKAGLNMVWQVMKSELKNVSVACVEPGIVDTEMLRYIRRNALEEGATKPLRPEVCAKFLAYLLSERVSAQEFSAKV